MPRFHDLWREGKPLRGLLCPLPSPFLVELAGHAGIDFVVLDAEHGPGDASLIHIHTTIAHAMGIASLVRVHPAELPSASRLIDLGADGVLVPDVRSADDAAAAAAALRAAPNGHRGFATGCSAAGWGLGDVSGHATRAPIIVAMLEHPDAIAATADISAEPGIDAVFVGRMDLAMAAGAGPDPAASVVSNALGHVRAHAHGRILETAPDAPLRLLNAPQLLGKALQSELTRA